MWLGGDGPREFQVLFDQEREQKRVSGFCVERRLGGNFMMTAVLVEGFNPVLR